MKKIKYVGFFVVLMLLISCGTSNVATMKTTNKDLSRYDTFAYLPNSNPAGTGINYNDEKVNTAVIETINMNMQQAGYNLDRENPDLLVLVSTKTNKETGVTSEPVYARYPYEGTLTTIHPYYSNYYYPGFSTFNRVVGYDTDTYQYREGTLVINLVDRETRETVWKGIASENIYNQGTTAAIRELVNEIFEQYPLNNQ